MKTRTLDDGSLFLEERLTLARWATVLGAMGLVAAFVFTYRVRGDLTGSEVVWGAIGVMALLGIAAALADRTFHFDRADACVRWKVQYLFATRSGEVPFADVVRVSLLTSTDVDDPYRHPTYVPILITRERPLALTSFVSRDPQSAADLARAIGRALGRAAEPVREATVEELVASHREVDAVRLVRREARVKGAPPMTLAEAKSIVDGHRAALESNDSGEDELKRAA